MSVRNATLTSSSRATGSSSERPLDPLKLDQGRLLRRSPPPPHRQSSRGWRASKGGAERGARGGLLQLVPHLSTRRRARCAARRAGGADAGLVSGAESCACLREAGCGGAGAHETTRARWRGARSSARSSSTRGPLASENARLRRGTLWLSEGFALGFCCALVERSSWSQSAAAGVRGKLVGRLSPRPQHHSQQCSQHGRSQARTPRPAVGRAAAHRVYVAARRSSTTSDEQLPRVPPRTRPRRPARARQRDGRRQELCRSRPSRPGQQGRRAVDLAPLPLLLLLLLLLLHLANPAHALARTTSAAQQRSGRAYPGAQAATPRPEPHLGPLRPARLRRPHPLAPPRRPRQDPPRPVPPRAQAPHRPERDGRRARLPDQGRPRPPAPAPSRRPRHARRALGRPAPVPRPALRAGRRARVGCSRRIVRPPAAGRLHQGVRGARRVGRAARPRGRPRRRARRRQAARRQGGRDALPRHRRPRGVVLGRRTARRRRGSRALFQPRRQGRRPRPVRARVQEAVRLRRRAPGRPVRRVGRRARPAAHDRRERGVLDPRVARRQGRPPRHDGRLRDVRPAGAPGERLLHAADGDPGPTAARTADVRGRRASGRHEGLHDPDPDGESARERARRAALLRPPVHALERRRRSAVARHRGRRRHRRGAGRLGRRCVALSPFLARAACISSCRPDR